MAVADDGLRPRARRVARAPRRRAVAYGWVFEGIADVRVLRMRAGAFWGSVTSLHPVPLRRRIGPVLTRLTDRERGILALLAEGRSNRSIASKLILSPKTIEGSIATIFSKLNLEPGPDDNRRVLAVLAYLDPRR